MPGLSSSRGIKQGLLRYNSFNANRSSFGMDWSQLKYGGTLPVSQYKVAKITALSFLNPVPWGLDKYVVKGASKGLKGRVSDFETKELNRIK